MKAMPGIPLRLQSYNFFRIVQTIARFLSARKGVSLCPSGSIFAWDGEDCSEITSLHTFPLWQV